MSADIEIGVDHGKGRDEARAAVAKVLDRMAEKMGVEATWDGDRATLSGTGVKSGEVAVDDQRITVTIRLGLMAKPMKGFVEEKVRSGIERALSA